MYYSFRKKSFERFLVQILAFLTRNVAKWSISSNLSLDGIPGGPYMKDMDEVTTPLWGSLIYYISVRSNESGRNVYFNDF